ncbi:MAG: N-acetylglucosamine-6-phosphate deacetylase [Acidobacteriota bacterium]|nr:N-acetylglucosamine-6-phosphate deacetylase [Acidobacteriota bacterium]
MPRIKTIKTASKTRAARKTKGRPRRSAPSASGRNPVGRPPAALTLIRASAVLTPEASIADGAILARGKRILAVGTYKKMEAAARRLHNRSRRFVLEIHDRRGLIAVPGFIDIHQHGGGGADYMDATPEAVRTILLLHAREGTTSIVPTLMTASKKDIAKAALAVDRIRREARRGRDKAGAKILPEIVGLHVEGPHIAAAKRGAQPRAFIRRFDPEAIQALQKAVKTPIRIVTLAPELPGAAAFIKFLDKRGIIPSAGHSAATFEQALAGFEAGVRHGTHLYNAMSGFGHREPGLAGALLLNDEASVELIADGHHLHPATIFLTMAAKPPDKVVLVTDATRPAGIRTEPLRTKDGKLFGSTLTLLQAVRNVIGWSGWPLADVLPLVTTNPARLLGLDKKKGALAKGFDADVVLLDPALHVHDVFVGGRAVFPVETRPRGRKPKSRPSKI